MKYILKIVILTFLNSTLVLKYYLGLFLNLTIFIVLFSFLFIIISQGKSIIFCHQFLQNSNFKSLFPPTVEITYVL